MAVTYEWYFVKSVSAIWVDTALTAHQRQRATLWNFHNI